MRRPHDVSIDMWINLSDLRQNVNVVVCLSSAVTLLIFNFIGAFIFVLAEKEMNETPDVVEDDAVSKCLKIFPIDKKITIEMKRKAEKCIRNESESVIDEFGKAFYFSWTLYSTVGYGNLYPHSSIGRFMTAFYSLLIIPVYIAFKFEFGTFLVHVWITAVKHTENYFKMLFNRVMNRVFVRVPIDQENLKSLHHRDRFIFFSSIVLCLICLISSSILFSICENISFSSSIYFGIISMSLIGLGDIVPTNLIWFIAYCFFFLITDILSNHFFYFCQARIRFFFHYFARRLLLKDRRNLKSESTVSIKNVPVINSQCMPSLAMDCERNELDKDEKLISSLSSSKNNTVKSMASDKSKQKPVVHTPPTNSGPSGGELEKKKAPKANEPQMAARDANDNETINDAKSDWGELPA
ncbi:hypothetical protein GCK72_009957 [Caenorhabditis remanei]|uniref:Potassium channel domain-containing protein n=1 Tax=Caenorhabditis remanei TaxID=31234 RepID=A0A6A5H415_CAERE|nr:hypothetical protein GCK72_009957 [Caenorhabditis remanei]KAF1761701.1 hypothetical protein GCK72_009957 [Caenorhabditis remanei]